MRDSITHAPQFIIDVQHRAARIAEERIDAFMDEGFNQDRRASRALLVCRSRSSAKGGWVKCVHGHNVGGVEIQSKKTKRSSFRKLSTSTLSSLSADVNLARPIKAMGKPG